MLLILYTSVVYSQIDLIQNKAQQNLTRTDTVDAPISSSINIPDPMSCRSIQWHRILQYYFYTKETADRWVLAA